MKVGRIEMMPTNEYVEVRNGGYYVAGTRIGLDVVVYDFRRDGLLRRFSKRTRPSDRWQRSTAPSPSFWSTRMPLKSI
jgi:hypothetical protein